MNRFFLFSIRLYQWFLSPFLGGCCRFSPSCSRYAHEAFTQHSTFKALSLSMRRVLRCHPFGAHGYDPVPK